MIETQIEKDTIKRMTPHVEKLITFLTKHGITFQHTDGDTPNVRLHKTGHQPWVCAHRCFYRFSGLCVIGQEKKKGKSTEFTLIPVDDDMFINSYMRALIMRHFKIK